MRRLFATVLVLCALTAACGGKGNPTEPSSSAGASAAAAGPASPAGPVAEPNSGGGAEAQLEGLVESLPPTTAPLTFKVAGRTVKTDTSTRFEDGSLTRTFADLRIGMRVHVKGTTSGDTINATLIEVQNDRVDAPVEVNGVIDTLSGSPAAFQFKVGSTLVKGDASTAFFGDGDKPDSFTDLKNGVRVEVKGQQADGFVMAIRIHVENDDDDDNPPQPPQNPEASIDGKLNAMAGAAPALTLTVNTTTVRTSSATTVKRRGDPVTLAALQVGQTLEVEGTRRSDGSIDARTISIEDDDGENENNEVELEGTMSGLTGACPALSFTVNSRSVVTNASTDFDKTACSAFKNGDRVQVKGRQQSGGSLLATRLRKKN
jgi:Domain of unknown function (DUF5666)